MAGQLKHLVAVSELSNVSVRVVPFDVGFQYGVASGAFTMLDFPADVSGRHTEPPTVYVDGLTGVLYLDKPQDIDRFRKAFTAISAVALDETASRTLIGAAARGFAR